MLDLKVMRPKVIILLFVILVAIFLRFYRLPELFVFTVDEEYQAQLAETIVKNFHVIWIGVNAAHLGFYLGPFWTYFTAFWLFIFKDPIITAYIAAFIGVITTILTFIVGYKLFNYKIALSATALYATLPLIVFFDQKYWNPTLIPTLSLVMILAIFLSNKNQNWWVVFAAAFGLVFHVHLSLLPFLILGCLFFFNQRRKISLKITIICIFIFLAIISPLLIFDYFHNWSNIKTPFRINEVTTQDSEKVNPTQHAKSLFQTLGRIWFLNPTTSNADENNWGCTSVSNYGSNIAIDLTSTHTFPSVWVSTLSLLTIIIFLTELTTWRDRARKILMLSIGLVMTFFIFFPGGAYEYYLLGIFPLIIFIPLLLISDFFRKRNFFLVLFITIIAALGINTVMKTNSDFGMENKKMLISKVSNIIKNDSFYVDATGKCHQYDGWRYLFKSYGAKPTSSFTDSLFAWLYQDEVSKIPPKYKVVISETREGLPTNSNQALEKITQGGYTALIFKNN